MSLFFDSLFTDLLKARRIAEGQMPLFGAPAADAPTATAAPAPVAPPPPAPKPVRAPAPAPAPAASHTDKNKPPGAGWVPIPNSYYRGMHRPKAGGGFEYWYPNGGGTEPTRADRRRIDPPPAPATPPLGHIPDVKLPAHLADAAPRMTFQQAQEHHGAANEAAHRLLYGKQLREHFTKDRERQTTEIGRGVLVAIVEAMRKEKPRTKFDDVPAMGNLWDVEKYFQDKLSKVATKTLGRERLEEISKANLREIPPGHDEAIDAANRMIYGAGEQAVFHKSGAFHDVYHPMSSNDAPPHEVLASLRRRGFRGYLDENNSVHANVSPQAPVAAWMRADRAAGGLTRQDEDSVDAHHAINGAAPDPSQEAEDAQYVGGQGQEVNISPFGVRNHSSTSARSLFSFPTVDLAAEAAPWHRQQQLRLEADEKDLRAEHPDAFTTTGRLADYKLEAARRRAYNAAEHAKAHGAIADAAEKYLKLKGRPVPK